MIRQIVINVDMPQELIGLITSGIMPLFQMRIMNYKVCICYGNIMVVFGGQTIRHKFATAIKSLKKVTTFYATECLHIFTIDEQYAFNESFHMVELSHVMELDHYITRRIINDKEYDYCVAYYTYSTSEQVFRKYNVATHDNSLYVIYDKEPRFLYEYVMFDFETSYNSYCSIVLASGRLILQISRADEIQHSYDLLNELYDIS
jgi:hypothetical protein